MMIKLVSSDNHTFEVEREVAVVSHTVRNMLEDTDEASVPLPNVNGDVEFCKHHHVHGTKQWDDSEFLDVNVAANYLNIKDLLDLGCETVAGMIKEKTTEELRALFNIENDLSPEEEEKIRREDAWAFE